ncbi:MAG: hypothetical protein HYU88_04580 [Chloroflexi bacterium]|nr:hypothetical protein [Chloroflexota bacterium]
MLSTLGARLRQADELIESLLREVLSGFIPICAWCRRIQAETGDWHPLETYVLTRTSAQLTHGICPDCEARARELGER